MHQANVLMNDEGTSMRSNKYNYGEENNVNMKLVVALKRSLQPEERRVTHLVNQYGLTMPQFGVLEALYHIGPMNINQIIDKTLSTSGNMTVVIKNLVKLGLVLKERDPEDGRAFLIRITDEGDKIISDLFPKHIEQLSCIFSTLDFNEKKELLKLLKKFNNYDKKSYLD